MKGRSLLLLLFAAFAAVLSACGGGSASTGSVGAANCDGGVGLCVTSCNLGCTSTGCSISDIAVNQPLVFTFNQEIDPASVNRATFQLRTDTGKEPVGTYVVQSNSILFVPDIEVIGNEVFFGFEDQATYTLTIPSQDDALDTVRAMSGAKVAQSFSCTLQVTRGIVDFDGRAPRATLIVPGPADLQAAKRDTLIIVEFSELVDTQALLQANEFTTGLGIHFRVAKRAKSGECATEDFRLEGSWTVGLNQATQRTRVVFRPAQLLPGNSCVIVRINDKPSDVSLFRLVRDLKGNPAAPTRIEFGTEAASTEEFEVAEDFSDPGTNRDAERDGFNWAQGAATPSVLGGSAVLGDLTLANLELYKAGVTITARDANNNPIAADVDASQVIVPNILSLSGVDQGVQNGVLEYATIQIATGESVRFVGDTPPILKASGQVIIEGTLSVSAPTPPNPSTLAQGGPAVGASGYPGGPGGGRGGKGGNHPFTGPTIGQIDGLAGETVQLPSGHPLAASVAGTGGAGSPANPQPGAGTVNKAQYDALATFSAFSGVLSQQVSAGGGGGSFVTVGTVGNTIDNNSGTAGTPNTADFGTPAQPGSTMDISSLFSRSESSAFLYGFGGSGGGGTGIHPMGSLMGQSPVYSSGGGGAGGGGFLWLKAGTDLILSNQGAVLAEGGDGARYQFDIGNNYGPGGSGGGSGGGILLQAGGTADLRGTVSVLGGEGGRMDALNYGFRTESRGGDGGAGFVRVESDPTPDYKSFLSFQPTASANNAGKLKSVDHDDTAMLFTNFYRTGLLFPPTYVAYVVEVQIGTQNFVFSDDPNRGPTKAEPGQPVVFFVQGAQAEGSQLKNPSPWYTGEIDPLNVRGGNSFRFAIRIDRSQASQPITIQSVKIYYQS